MAFTKLVCAAIAKGERGTSGRRVRVEEKSLIDAIVARRNLMIAVPNGGPRVQRSIRSTRSATNSLRRVCWNAGLRALIHILTEKVKNSSF